jgi:hypothetical protein
MNTEYDKTLIALYNRGVDFVRKHGDRDYVEVEGPKYATHHLVCTAENVPEDPRYKRNSKGKLVMEAGYALSVAAEQMKVHFGRTTVQVRRRWPHGRMTPVYHADGTLKGKRVVLAYLVEALRPRHLLHFRRLVKTISETDADQLYRNFIRASRLRREALREARLANEAENSNAQ